MNTLDRSQRIEWHTRGMRDLTPQERDRLLGFVGAWWAPIMGSQRVRAHCEASDLLGGNGETTPLPSTWHETDNVHVGTIVAFDANEGGAVLVRRDDGTFACVPVVCIKAAPAESAPTDVDAWLDALEAYLAAVRSIAPSGT